MTACERIHWFCCCSTLVAGLLLHHSQPLHAADKAPIPPVGAQNAALALVKEMYGEEYARAQSSEQKTALARKLLQTAKKTDQGTSNHYALLRIAWDVATGAGDTKLAMQVTDEMVEAYEVKALNAKAATVEATAESARSSAQRTTLAAVAMDVVDEAVAGEDYSSAAELAEMALAAARKAQDWQLVKQIVARDRAVKEIAGAYARAQEALATLEHDPTNPEANQVTGEYFCFIKGDWTKGIPMLALGNDETLKALAQRDLKGADSPDEQVEMGDGWWQFARTKQGDQREAMLLRAGSWYREAKARLAPGLVLDKVDKRLKEIDEATRESPAKQERTTTRAPSGIKKTRTVDIRDFQGRWIIKYDNRAVRTYVIDAKGIVASYPQGRPPGQGRLTLFGNDILLNLGDGKLERLRVVDGTLRVEHFNPASSFPHRVTNTGVGTKAE